MISLVKRNLIRYFRHRSGVFFSLLGALSVTAITTTLWPGLVC
ncbi:hypothetical protein [Oenococcus sicerae]|nr:hypothetical protein OAL24_00924 [Oenococcus sicerae]